MTDAKKKVNKKKKGFTLVELVVVVAIIAILALIAVPRFVNMTESGRVATMESNHNALRTAITLYSAEHGGELPPADGANSDELPNVLGKYLQDITLDADGDPTTSVHTYFNEKDEKTSYNWDGTTLTSRIEGLKGSYADRKAGEFDPADNSYTIISNP